MDLEPLRADHAGEMARAPDDPALYRYTGGAPILEEELAARYARQAKGVSPDGRQGWLNWIVRLRAGGHAAGFVQASLTAHAGAMSADLAWVIGMRHQGAGVATEAASAVLEWLRTNGVATLTAHIHPGNKASAVVARRIGLVETSLQERGETVWKD